jgi:hypothetical protein
MLCDHLIPTTVLHGWQAHVQQGVFMIVCFDCQPGEISAEGKVQHMKQELEQLMFSRQVCDCTARNMVVIGGVLCAEAHSFVSCPAVYVESNRSARPSVTAVGGP